MTRLELKRIIAAFGGADGDAFRVSLTLSSGAVLHGSIHNPDAPLVRIDLVSAADGFKIYGNCETYVSIAAIEAVTKFAV
jgi:hypothetical protein